MCKGEGAAIWSPQLPDSLACISYSLKHRPHSLEGMGLPGELCWVCETPGEGTSCPCAQHAQVSLIAPGVVKRWEKHSLREHHSSCSIIFSTSLVEQTSLISIFPECPVCRKHCKSLFGIDTREMEDHLKVFIIWLGGRKYALAQELWNVKFHFSVMIPTISAYVCNSS